MLTIRKHRELKQHEGELTIVKSSLLLPPYRIY